MGSVMREITSPTNRLVYKINENDEITTITIAINKTNDLKNINVKITEKFPQFILSH